MARHTRSRSLLSDAAGFLHKFLQASHWPSSSVTPRVRAAEDPLSRRLARLETNLNPVKSLELPIDTLWSTRTDVVPNLAAGIPTAKIFLFGTQEKGYVLAAICKL